MSHVIEKISFHSLCTCVSSSVSSLVKSARFHLRFSFPFSEDSFFSKIIPTHSHGKDVSSSKRTEHILWAWTWPLATLHSWQTWKGERPKSGSSLAHHRTLESYYMLGFERKFSPGSNCPAGLDRDSLLVQASDGESLGRVQVCTRRGPSPAFLTLTYVTDDRLRLLPRPCRLSLADVCRWPAISNASL